MNAYKKVSGYTDEELINILNEAYGKVKIGKLIYPVGQALKERDPLTFRLVAFNLAGKDDCNNLVWVCSQCKHEYDNEDEAENCCKPE